MQASLCSRLLDELSYARLLSRLGKAQTGLALLSLFNQFKVLEVLACRPVTAPLEASLGEEPEA